ncbi:MAG: PD-(D/E)XK nuclease family protein [Candidatus Hodarchaeales archaeon]
MKPSRLRISSLVGLDCPRRVVGYLLQQKFGIEETIPFNGYILAGDINHKIIQSVLLDDEPINLVRYNYSRLGYDLRDSIIAVMMELLEDWESLVTSEYFPNSMKTYDISIALDRVEKQIPHMADLSSELVSLKDGLITSHGIADEYIVQTVIGNSILVGHIDIVALVDGKLKLIEIKTGREKKMDSVQLMLYGEIFNSASNIDNVTMELWYTGTGKKKCIEPEEGKLLDVLRKHIENIDSYTMENIPAPKNNAEDCNYCKYCDLIESFEQSGFFE